MVRSAVVTGLVALVAATGLVACSSDDDGGGAGGAGGAVGGAGGEGGAAADAGVGGGLVGDVGTPDAAPLAACPDEVDLTTVSLPCDCYGNIASDPTVQVPDCRSQVVCCPSIQNLRCEDHEYFPDAGPDAATPDAAEPDAAEEIPACPNEVDLASHVPCDCYGTIVRDTEEAMPACDARVVCCPGLRGLKCE